MFCKNCGKELADDAKFCIECGQPVAYSEAKSNIESSAADSEGNVSNINDTPVEESIPKVGTPEEITQAGTPEVSTPEVNINKAEKLLKIKLKNPAVIAGISVAAVVVVLLCGWLLSGGILINMANSAIEDNNLDKAESYLKYSCPIGYKNDEVKDLEARISTARSSIEEGRACLEVNDYISAINASYAAYDALSNYGEAQQFYIDASNSFLDWMNELYDQGEFSEAAHSFAQLEPLVANDTENERLNELRAKFMEKSDEFLVSAQNYYNTFEPDKASENVTIVLALDSENTAAQDLKAKIDSYNENKAYIDEAQKYYNDKDYGNALASFNKADDYTKNVHKDLKSQIETAKQNQEIDNKYSVYVGSYYDPMLEMGSDEITITKIEDGKIWLEGSRSGDDFGLSYSVNGASIASGTVSVTSYGQGIDYDAIVYNNAPSGTTKSITGSETITLKNGHIYHTSSFNDSDYLRTTTYELYKR